MLLRVRSFIYSGIRIYSGIYSGYSAPGSRIAGMEIQVFQNENSSHYSNYSYSGLIPNERTLSFFFLLVCFGMLHYDYSISFLLHAATPESTEAPNEEITSVPQGKTTNNMQITCSKRRTRDYYIKTAFFFLYCIL